VIKGELPLIKQSNLRINKTEANFQILSHPERMLGKKNKDRLGRKTLYNEEQTQQR